MARRAQESKLQDFTHKVKAEFNMKSKAEWENKTTDVMQQQAVSFVLALV
jgi:hypothetical protein